MIECRVDLAAFPMMPVALAESCPEALGRAVL